MWLAPGCAEIDEKDRPTDLLILASLALIIRVIRVKLYIATCMQLHSNSRNRHRKGRMLGAPTVHTRDDGATKNGIGRYGYR